MWGILQAAGQPNAYDITTWDPNVDQITFSTEVLLNMEEVKLALHAPLNITWHGCRPGGGRRKLMATDAHRRLYMDNDRPFSVVPYIAELLDEGIPVIVYNGDRDMTTNMVGSELALNEMVWSGKKEWLHAKRGLWNIDKYGKKYPAGWVKEFGGLTFAVVYNSGHMVPYNEPLAAYDLLLRLLQKDSFIDDELPQFHIHSEEVTAQVEACKNTGQHSLRRDANLVLVSIILGVLLSFLAMRRKKKGYYEVGDISF